MAYAAKAEMLIRKPASTVFEAFADPAVTSQFWFSRGSGRLEPGARVQWEWKWYGFTVDVVVKAAERNRRILVEWSAYGTPTTIEWTFTDRPDGTTFVRVENAGFEDPQMAIDSTEGFAFMLAGAKALLEHGVHLGLVPDRFPDGVPKG